MIELLVASLLIVAFIFFFLSVAAPMNSSKPFWKAIYRIRSFMDFTSYWFLNLCWILFFLYVLLMAGRSFLQNYIL